MFARLLPMLLMLVVLLGAAAAQERPPAPPAANPGWCIVCEAPARPGAVTEIHKGRRVTVCDESCRATWHEHEDELFASMQARGALFDESALNERSLLSGWMWFGSYVLVGLVCAAIAAYVALGKGLAPLPWLLAGLAFNVLALCALAAKPRGDLSRLPEGVPSGLRKIPATHSPTCCAKCGTANHPSAQACAGCGAALSARFESEARRIGPKGATP